MSDIHDVIIKVNYNPTVVLTDAGQEKNRPNFLQRATQIVYCASKEWLIHNRRWLIVSYNTIMSHDKYHITLRDELMHPDVFHLKSKPTKNRTLLTKYLPNTRITVKSKGIENQSLR